MQFSSQKCRDPWFLQDSRIQSKSSGGSSDPQKRAFLHWILHPWIHFLEETRVPFIKHLVCSRSRAGQVDTSSFNSQALRVDINCSFLSVKKWTHSIQLLPMASQIRSLPDLGNAKVIHLCNPSGFP